MNSFFCLAVLAGVYAQAQNYLSGQVILSQQQRVSVQTLTDQLDDPRGIACLPDGRTLVAERAGQIRIIQDGRLLDQNITGVPRVHAKVQGLTDIKLHPNYVSNKWIYLTYSKPKWSGWAGQGARDGGTVVSRAKLTGNAMHSIEELWTAPPFSETNLGKGTKKTRFSRIVFDGRGHMFVSFGDKRNAQIMRLIDDGRVSPDNLLHDPKDGLDYNGLVLSSITESEGMVNALQQWNPFIGHCATGPG